MSSPNPNPSKLDQQQVLQRSFDEQNDRLRVETDATVVNGAMEVSISDTTDSIKIGDGSGSNYVGVTSGNLNVVNFAQLVPNIYNYISLYQTTTTDTWTYRNGGPSGSIVANVTITYTDTSKQTISSVYKT